MEEINLLIWGIGMLIFSIVMLFAVVFNKKPFEGLIKIYPKTQVIVGNKQRIIQKN